METPIRFFEWQSKKYSQFNLTFSGKDFLEGFQGYLNEVWQSRNRYKQSDQGEEKGGTEQRFFTFALNEIKARNFVGVIQYGGKRFEIYPKILRDQEAHNYKNYFQHFFYWLSYCRKLNFPVSKTALNDIKDENFFEAFIFLFAHYAEEILTEQPFQAFEEVLEETSFLRSRLAISEYIRQNFSTGRWQYFQSEYEPLQYDNLFNRIVKYTSRILAEVSTSSTNKKKLQEIQFLLDEVSDVVCVASDCDKVKLNPLYADLEDILKLCKMFLSNLNINNEKPSDSNFCFLLPMEYVFEDFMFSFIKVHFPELKPEEQVGGFLAHNGTRNVFKLKNDILIRNKQLIVDTKYKIRYYSEDGKDGVGQNDLYQMLAYAVKRGYHEVLLLYPETLGSAKESKFNISSPYWSGKSIQITAQNIKIDSDSIESLDTIVKDQLLKIFGLKNIDKI